VGQRAQLPGSVGAEFVRSVGPSFPDLPELEKEVKAFDLEQLATAADGFSGAEIEAAVKAALLDAFMDGEREICTADVLRRVCSIRPTSEVKWDEIEELRKWARDHLAIDAVRGQPAATGERLMEF
jgi:hypothetical protein